MFLSRLAILPALCALSLSACNRSEPAPKANEVVIYSGRSETLVAPLFKKLEGELGLRIRVKYGSSAGLAATLLEEQAAGGAGADLFFSQDAGALGLLAKAGALEPLPQRAIDRVEPTYRSAEGLWVGVSGRARSVVVNTDALSKEDYPRSLKDFTQPRWKDRVGWAPTNASFQAQVTAMRLAEGNDATEAWLRAMRANGAKEYPKNTPIVEAVARGEIDAGLVNHYYLHRLQAKGQAKNVRNLFLPGVGSVINVAGVGILKGKSSEAALRVVDALLSEDSQRYFTEETYEYPLVKGAAVGKDLTPLESEHELILDLAHPQDLEGTLALMRKVSVLH